MFVFGAVLLCTILPSSVAFTSLISAGAVPTIAAYGLIALLRLTQTRNDFRSTKFDLGRLKIPFYLSAVVFNGLIVAVSSIAHLVRLERRSLHYQQVLVSPLQFPVTAQNLNYVRFKRNRPIFDARLNPSSSQRLV